MLLIAGQRRCSRPIPSGVTDSADPGWFKKALVATALGVVATVAGAVILNSLHLGGDTTPRRPPASSSAASAPPAPSSSDRTEPVVHTIILTQRVKLADGIGWDLDVEPGDRSFIQSNWTAGTDLGYTSWDKEIDEDAILTPDNKMHAASLPKGAKGTREECAAADYGNFAVGQAILPGRLVCVETTSGRYALLRVVAKDPRTNHWSVTVEATVWS